MHTRPAYFAVFKTFARNSLVRAMMFRANFVIECITSVCWMSMQLVFYILIFQYTNSIGIDPTTGDPLWTKFQFFAFIATTMMIFSVMQAFFMPNAAEFSELIRTGGLDFALLKPIDTQFLISLARVNWASLSNFLFGIILLFYALAQLNFVPDPIQYLLFPLYIVCGIGIMYSLMIALASTSIWMGRNQSLYDFWFYVTNFSRYPMEIYRGPIGTPLQKAFTFAIPILIVANVPARLMAKPFDAQNWWLAAYAIFATVASLYVSRKVFQLALGSYRSASS
ncbi:MAG: ABC-2 family transporter protein [Pirellulales bacterium]|nr:ABC-2 family transporter protein [Pirellulales bacterium]